jgi:hypothetical protein
MIHDRLRPIFGEYMASTIGDHNNLSEYGYAAKEKIPTCEYETLDLRINGIDPKASPTGTP